MRWDETLRLRWWALNCGNVDDGRQATFAFAVTWLKEVTLGGSDMRTSQPAWQTEELQDEWPDEGDSGDDPHTRSISLTTPVSPQANPVPVADVDLPGTFLIRQDVPSTKTPGRGKGIIKDFFSPIPLERLFDPPSPARVSSHSVLSPPAHGRIAHHVPTTSSRITSQSGSVNSNPSEAATFDGWQPNMHCQFTFKVPDPAPLSYVTSPGFARPKGTPGAATSIAPSVDPPLRLFQFQYDTFTRDHLSAMVDSIAINSLSVSNAENLAANNSSPFGLPTVSEASGPFSSVELRSAKRVKLSPVSDFGDSENSSSCGTRDLVFRKDYIGESRSLMARIKNARDISMLSTPVSNASTTHSDAKHNSPAEMRAQGECRSALARVSSVSPISWKLCLPPMAFRRTKFRLQLHTKGRLIPLWVTDNKQRA